MADEGEYVAEDDLESMQLGGLGIRKKGNILQIWGNEKTMNLNSMVLTNIQQSPYFKIQLADCKTYHEVLDQIYTHVTHLEPWEKGSRRTSGQIGMCGGVRGVGAGGIVSSAFCLLYKLFTLKLTRKQLTGLINHADSPYLRGLGLMYVRFCQPPADLWEWYEPYLDDNEEIDPKAGGGDSMTIGQMVRHFLTRLDWYGTLFPRIPLPVTKVIEQKLAERRQKSHQQFSQDNARREMNQRDSPGKYAGSRPGLNDKSSHRRSRSPVGRTDTRRRSPSPKRSSKIREDDSNRVGRRSPSPDERPRRRRSPSPPRKRRSSSPAVRHKRSTSPAVRRKRSPSPAVRRKRSPSPVVRRKRSPSPPVRRRVSPSRDRYKPSPSPNVHRKPSPEKRRNSPSPVNRTNKGDSNARSSPSSKKKRTISPEPQRKKSPSPSSYRKKDSSPETRRKPHSQATNNGEASVKMQKRRKSSTPPPSRLVKPPFQHPTSRAGDERAGHTDDLAEMIEREKERQRRSKEAAEKTKDQEGQPKPERQRSVSSTGSLPDSVKISPPRKEKESSKHSHKHKHRKHKHHKRSRGDDKGLIVEKRAVKRD